MPEELETVLRLVAEGKLSPDEASPIIEALTRAERRDADDEEGSEAGTDVPWRGVERVVRHATRHARRADWHIERAFARAERGLREAEMRVGEIGDRLSTGHHLRVRVTERGRQVVNLRVPIGFVESALQFVPGLGGDQAQRIRDAVRSGAIGPILDVEDPDGLGGVFISVE
jgi:hypothetical protein